MVQSETRSPRTPQAKAEQASAETRRQSETNSQTSFWQDWKIFFHKTEGCETRVIKGDEMKGENKIRINKDTIREALEYYLNSNVFLRDRIRVDTWRRDKTGNLVVSFTVIEKMKDGTK